VILGCAAWKDRVNMEDMLFAGAVISKIRKHFSINCDSSHLAETIYKKAEKDLFGFMKKNEASHYHRLMGFWVGKRYSLLLNCRRIKTYYPYMIMENWL
jgi:2-phosphosulfolactate phosphatase